MSFLNPMFLFAAFAAMIPLILHLMARRQTVRMPFSTIRFLKLAQKQSSTKVRMENLLLWLLRTLLMLLLAGAFAKPVLRLTGSNRFSAMLGTSQRDVAIIWDASYSMGYETGRKNVWDTSKETVESIIRGLNKGDRVSVFLAADTVIPVVGEPTKDLDFALATVKGQNARTTTSNLSEATLAALEDDGLAWQIAEAHDAVVAGSEDGCIHGRLLTEPRTACPSLARVAGWELRRREPPGPERRSCHRPDCPSAARPSTWRSRGGRARLPA